MWNLKPELVGCVRHLCFSVHILNTLDGHVHISVCASLADHHVHTIVYMYVHLVYIRYSVLLYMTHVTHWVNLGCGGISWSAVGLSDSLPLQKQVLWVVVISWRMGESPHISIILWCPSEDIIFPQLPSLLFSFPFPPYLLPSRAPPPQVQLAKQTYQIVPAASSSLYLMAPVIIGGALLMGLLAYKYFHNS